MSTQSTPQISDFQKINRRKNILTVSKFSYEIKCCSLPCSGPWDRHAETNALRDDLNDNCKQDYDSEANWK